MSAGTTEPREHLVVPTLPATAPSAVRAAADRLRNAHVEWRDAVNASREARIARGTLERGYDEGRSDDQQVGGSRPRRRGGDVPA